VSRLLSSALVRRLRDERGFSLVFTLLTMLVTTVTLTSVVQYTTSNSHSSKRSEADQIAYSLAEAGLNNGAAVLSNPSNNALQQATLPTTEPCGTAVLPCVSNYAKVYEGGTSKWWGVLTGHVWIMHGVGYVPDPTGRTGTVRREATSTIKIQPTLKQNLNNNAFNYIFAKSTGAADGCDVRMQQSVAVDTSLFILGGLCFENTSSVVKATAPNLTALVVGKTVQFLGTGSVGASTAKIGEAHIKLGCRIGSSGSYTNPCTSGTRVWADTVDSATVANDGGPVADFAFWYANAKPGPGQFCTTGYSTGTSTTMFEAAGSTTMSAAAGPYSVGPVNLTPTTSYTCRYYDIPPAQADLLGELSWNASTKVLTVRGAIFIDGSAYVSNNSTNSYSGLGTLYVAGTFTIDGSSQLCGAVSGGTCSFSAWDPNTNNLGIVANGKDGSNYGVKVQNSAQYQGSIYATNDVLIENNTAYDGPIVSNTFALGNSVVTHEFPTITSVPVGWPGNPTVYAEPQPPQSYSG
jgi:Tfp pilus assembly protein PilX